jgi:hypothetical protein
VVGNRYRIDEWTNQLLTSYQNGGQEREDADLLYLFFFISFESFVFFAWTNPVMADPKVPPHRIGFFYGSLFWFYVTANDGIDSATKTEYPNPN